MNSNPDLRKTLLQVSKTTHGRISDSQTYSDFLAYSALLCSARSDPVHRESRFRQLLELKKSYRDTEWEQFHACLQAVCNTAAMNLDRSSYDDIFSGVYQELNLCSKSLKQDFTPVDLAKLMAALSLGDHPDLPESGYFTLSDPTCGSGVLLLAAAEHLAACGYNPTMQLVVQAADLDIRCVHMAYLNLSLYGIPAVIVHGNSLTLQEYDRWYTPAYLWNRWVWHEPMPFGDSGRESDELLKMADDSLYRACRCAAALESDIQKASDDMKGDLNT